MILTKEQEAELPIPPCMAYSAVITPLMDYIHKWGPDVAIVAVKTAFERTGHKDVRAQIEAVPDMIEALELALAYAQINLQANNGVLASDSIIIKAATEAIAKAKSSR